MDDNFEKFNQETNEELANSVNEENASVLEVIKKALYEESAENTESNTAEPNFNAQQTGQNTGAEQNSVTGNRVPPYTPPAYTAYWDTNSGYAPYTHYPQAKQAEKVHSKNKRLGITVAVVIIVFSLILVSAAAVFLLTRYGKAQNENKGTEEKIEAEIPFEDPKTENFHESEASVIYKNTYETNVGVLVYSRNQSTIASEGSGVILPTVISGNGKGKTYIVTCAHVLETSSSYKTVVTTNDGDQYDATIVGVDRKTDIGVLSIDATGLKAAEFAASSSVSVGDTVYALGNPGGSTFFGSFTNGMVSAIGRPVNSPVGYEVSCIQHTAAINPGNSGGALLNSAGQVIGINSSKIASTDYEGMGFAVPSETVKEIVEKIIANGYVTGRAVLGITFYPSTYSQVHSAIVQTHDLPSGSLIINSISPNSDLVNKDVKEGDLVIGFNGKDLEDYNELLDFVENGSVGDELTLKICRIDQNYKISTFEITVKLVEDRGDLLEDSNG
ncbi:MAG: trypsin-like peptidase domain-containing protein [Oscillospiraceae bacterium]|nr:trypsin-like peptidase domain-containing protein [Oscillospiraceae bacterium]